MTVEELRVEADKLGYTIRKKPEKLNLMKCTCGYELDEVADLQVNKYGKYYKCPRCKLVPRGSSRRSEKLARQTWNTEIRRRLLNG